MLTSQHNEAKCKSNQTTQINNKSRDKKKSGQMNHLCSLHQTGGHIKTARYTALSMIKYCAQFTPITLQTATTYLFTRISQLWFKKCKSKFVCKYCNIPNAMNSKLAWALMIIRHFTEKHNELTLQKIIIHNSE